jgi:hypothetical protein
MEHVLTAAFPPRSQVRAEVLALKLPGKAMHVRALCSGLSSVRSSLLYVKNRLEGDTPWQLVQDTVARELTMSSMFLSGILDGCVIAELDPGRPPTRHMSFAATPFQDGDLRAIQEEVAGLRSVEEADQEAQADFWTVVNFWKHYLPYQPLPITFTCGRLHALRDFQLVLTGDGESLSGPVVHDLLIPVFNAACRITDRLSVIYGVDGGHSVPPIEM